MITTTDYFRAHDATGDDLRDRYPLDIGPQIEHDADVTIGCVNLLLTKFGEWRSVNSGWRPPSYNATVPGASRTSKHMTARAIDINDPDGRLGAWCMSPEGEAALVEIGLWIENPAATTNERGQWVHFQTVPPKSRNRVFWP
jgi:hypothetical protein